MSDVRSLRSLTHPPDTRVPGPVPRPRKTYFNSAERNLVKRILIDPEHETYILDEGVNFGHGYRCPCSECKIKLEGRWTDLEQIGLDL